MKASELRALGKTERESKKTTDAATVTRLKAAMKKAAAMGFHTEPGALAPGVLQALQADGYVVLQGVDSYTINWHGTPDAPVSPAPPPPATAK